MIHYSKRLDQAMRTAAWAHEQASQHRKGTDIPYIMHPFGAMLIASKATNNEDTLIACLFHDILEDVPAVIYSREQMQQEFGDSVVSIVLDVTKDSDETDWRTRSRQYLDHLASQASDQAVIVSLADKIHNLSSILFDYDTIGDELWQRFTTKSLADQQWWYRSILKVARSRHAPMALTDQLAELVAQFARI